MQFAILASLAASAEALVGERILRRRDDLIELFASLLMSQIEVCSTFCFVVRMKLQVTVAAVGRTVGVEEVKNS